MSIKENNRDFQKLKDITEELKKTLNTNCATTTK